MADGMPSTYDTQTTTTSTTRRVFFDKAMLRNREVILKLAEMLVDLICLICVACATNTYVDEAGLFDFVAGTGIVVALVLFVLYVLHLRDMCAGALRLNLVEFVYAAVWCVLFFAAGIAGITHGTKYYGQGALTAAGVFGLVAMVLYGLDAFIMFTAWRSGTTRTASQTTHETTTTAY